MADIHGPSPQLLRTVGCGRDRRRQWTLCLLHDCPEEGMAEAMQRPAAGSVETQAALCPVREEAAGQWGWLQIKEFLPGQSGLCGLLVARPLDSVTWSGRRGPGQFITVAQSHLWKAWWPSDFSGVHSSGRVSSLLWSKGSGPCLQTLLLNRPGQVQQSLPSWRKTQKQ